MAYQHMRHHTSDLTREKHLGDSSVRQAKYKPLTISMPQDVEARESLVKWQHHFDAKGIRVHPGGKLQTWGQEQKLTAHLFECKHKAD